MSTHGHHLITMASDDITWDEWFESTPTEKETKATKGIPKIRKLLHEYFGKKAEYSSYQLSILVGLEKITARDSKKFMVQQFLDVKKSISRSWMIDRWREVATYQNHDIIHMIYKLTPEECVIIARTLSHEELKKNTLCFYGESNSGKSILARSLLLPFSPGSIQRDGGTNVHWLENTLYKNFVLWEEPIVNTDTKEDVKLLCGGERHIVNCKNQPLQYKEDKSIVIITTNTPFWLTDLTGAIRNRMHLRSFTKQVPMRLRESDVLGYFLIQLQKYDQNVTEPRTFRE